MMTSDQFTALLKVIQPGMSQAQIDASVAAFQETANGTEAEQRSRAIAGFIAGMQAETALDEAKQVIALYRGVVAKILDAMKDLPQ